MNGTHEKICQCMAKIIDKVEREEFAINAVVGIFNTQQSPVRYRPITLAGVPSKHNGHTVVQWEYCPFCGQRLEGSGG